MVTPASTQDRAGAALLLKAARAAGRGRLAHVWADKGYIGSWRHWARRELGVTVEVVAQPPAQHGFHVLPRRWVVERTHAWITRRRRCARDYERLPEHHAAWAYLAAIFQMTRRLAAARDDNPSPTQGLETASNKLSKFREYGPGGGSVGQAGRNGRARRRSSSGPRRQRDKPDRTGTCGAGAKPGGGKASRRGSRHCQGRLPRPCRAATRS